MTQLERLTGLMIIKCSLLSAQSVTVEPGKWIESGIELTPYSSPAFAAKLASISPVSPRLDTTPLHPFSFFLTNNTGQKIIVYSALWTVKSPSGFISRHHRMVGTLKSPNGNLSIPKGADRLVNVVNGAVSPIIDDPRTNSQIIENLQAGVPEALKMFPINGEVTITLEAVVLDDGVALGPDSAHAIPHQQAQVDAEKKLASDVLTAFSGGGDQALVDLLTSVVSSYDPKTAPSPLAASRMPSPSDAYAVFLADARYTLARHWLGVAKSNSAVLMRLANQKMNETGVAVHR